MAQPNEGEATPAVKPKPTPSNIITASAFANLYGMSESDTRIAEKRHKNEQHTEAEWYKALVGDFKLNHDLKSVTK